jgi:hypothetical protein
MLVRKGHFLARFEADGAPFASRGERSSAQTKCEGYEKQLRLHARVILLCNCTKFISLTTSRRNPGTTTKSPGQLGGLLLAGPSITALI